MKIQIVTGPDISALVAYAADELQRYIHDLFRLDAIVVPEPGDADATAYFLANDAPEDDQSFRLRRQGRDIVVAGGSPEATMWAVYELVERWGVRYTLHGDVLPDNPGTFTWPDVDEVFAPNLRCRCWRLVNDFCCGPESWGLEETQRFIDQIAKMKYNEVVISFWPWQSYLHFTFNGVDKRTGMSWFGFDYQIDDDTVGQELFNDAQVFENPDLAGITDYQQRYEAARAQAQGIIDHARARGITSGIAVQLFEYPLEFTEALPGAEIAHQLNELTCRPGKDHAPDDPMVIDLARTILRAYVQTYPDADYVYLSMPEHREFIDQAPRAWAKLNEKFGVSQIISLDDAIERASQRTELHGGADRQVTRVKGDVIALYVLTKVLEDATILQRPGRESVRVIYSDLADELEPIITRLGPPDRQLRAFVDYTARRVADQIDALDHAPTDKVDCRLMFTLADDNVGILPQLSTRPLHTIATRMREQGWIGFNTRYWMIGDLDPTVHYLARSCWHDHMTPDNAFNDLAEHVCGPEAAESMCGVWNTIEQITDTFDREGMGYAFPVPGMIMKHYDDANVHNESMCDVRTRYEQAETLAREAQNKSRPKGRSFATYFVKRLCFAMHFMDACAAVREAGIADRESKVDRAIECLENAIDLVRRSAQAYAEVAKDNSDRGAIAILDRECHRPLRKKLAELRG